MPIEEWMDMEGEAEEDEEEEAAAAEVVVAEEALEDANEEDNDDDDEDDDEEEVLAAVVVDDEDEPAEEDDSDGDDDDDDKNRSADPVAVEVVPAVVAAVPAALRPAKQVTAPPPSKPSKPAGKAGGSKKAPLSGPGKATGAGTTAGGGKATASSKPKKKPPSKSKGSASASSPGQKDRHHPNDPLRAGIASPKSLSAARDARALLHEAVQNLPLALEETTVRSFGRLKVLSDPFGENRYATAGALYPVGFSCDRYEFSPIHGRHLKIRCSILDGKKVREQQKAAGVPANQQVKADGPVFRLMWGNAVDEDAAHVEYPYLPQAHSAPITSGSVALAIADPNAGSAAAGGGKGGASSRAARRTLEPSAGMRVRVYYDKNEWHNGTIVESVERPSPPAAGKKKAPPKTYNIKIRYDDASLEEIVYPDSDVGLLLPGTEEEVDSQGNVDLSELNGKPVTSVVAASPIEAWGKALVKMGLIDEIMLDFAVEQLQKSRLDALQEAKNRLEGTVASTPQALKSLRDAMSDAMSVGSTHSGPSSTPAGNGAETKDDSSRSPDSEPPSEREKAFRAMTEDLLQELEAAMEEDHEAAVELADARIQLHGPLLCNPFNAEDQAKSQQTSWLATAVRKEKLKMGSTGNRRKLVTALDLLERNDTLYSAEIEALIEGLPGSEYCNTYVFKSYRGNAATNRQWMHEAQLRREKEATKRIHRQRESEEKVQQEKERMKKRKERDDVRDAKKKQKLEEEDQKKRARIEERLARLKVQVDEKLHNEASFQREKVIAVLARSQAKEFVRRRKAAESVAAQSIVEAKAVTTQPATGTASLPSLSESFEEDTIRIWNFMTTFSSFFMERGYISEVPTLDALQAAIDTIRNGDGLLMSSSDATSTLTDMAVAMCKPLAASLTRVLFASLISLNPVLQRDFGAAFFNEVNASVGAKDETDESVARTDVLLPVNSMTWQEIARVSMLADALVELGYQRHEAAHFLRGYRSAGHPTSKEARRLRKAEDIWVALLRQEVELGRTESRVEPKARLMIDIPCSPLCTTKDFMFFLYSIKSLPDPTLQDVKSNLNAAMGAVQSADHDGAMEQKQDLLRLLGLLDEHAAASGKDAKVPRKLKNKFLQLFDKYAAEASSQYGASAFEGLHDREWQWLETLPKKSSSMDINEGALRREQGGQLKALLVSPVDYKRLSQSREQYMERALRWKEEEQLKTMKDEDEEEEDDEFDDENGKDESRPASAVPSSGEPQGSEVLNAQNGDVGASEVAVNGCKTSVGTKDQERIGKPTEYDDFCGDIPTAPETLRRCLAVLRALCCSSQASGFLNPVDPQSNPGHYDSMLQPMCLREVGQQLQAAAAKVAQPDTDVRLVVDDAVAQFGRNVRLIEQNTRNLGNAGPTVVSMSAELLRIFERLFLDWVLAPEHLLPSLASLDDEKCVDHHPSDEESTVLFCDGCEGKYNITRLNPPLSAVPDGDWYCPRCVSGRWWGHLDPRVGKEIKTVDNSQIGVVKSCFFRYPEKVDSKPSLMYVVELGGSHQETWSLGRVNEALQASGVDVPPMVLLEARAESPGYGNGVDVGLRQELVPIAANPLVSETAAQVSLSSSVFRDTIAAAGSLMLVDPEDMTASEWLRLLALLTMMCSSSDVIQTVVSKMENAAAESVAGSLEKIGKVSSIKDILPGISDDEPQVVVDDVMTTDAAGNTPSVCLENNGMSEVAVIAHMVDSSTKPDPVPEDGPHHTVVVDAVELVEDMDVEPTLTLSAKDQSPDIPVCATEVATEIAAEEPPYYAMALLEKKRRRKTIEDSIAAYCIKAQLKPSVASFEEDRVSQVVDSTLNATVPGLDFASVRCRRRNCDLCGLLDVALGAPLVRVPDQDEWAALMPHAIRNRRVYLVATTSAPADGFSSSPARNVAVRVRVDGEIFSVRDDDLDHIPDGGMLEFAPRADPAFQSDLAFRAGSGLPFVTGSLSAHGCCAAAAHGARKELLVQAHRERRADLVEREAGRRCGRSLEVGRDGAGRSYWKFTDDESLFVLSPGESPGGPPLWQRFEGPARVASVLFALSKDGVVEDLKHVFPQAAEMLRNGSWKNALFSHLYPKALKFAQAQEKEEEDAMEAEVSRMPVLGGLDPYSVNEAVLVESKTGTMLWDAVVSGVSRRRLGPARELVIDAYRVEYTGWNRRFTEWVEPKRVVEPNENNRLLQGDLDAERAATRGGLPPALNLLSAKDYFWARDRARGTGPLPDFDRAARAGDGKASSSPPPSSSESTLGLVRAALLAIECALPVGSVDATEGGPWNPGLAARWRRCVEGASGPARLMQCAILLEDAIGEDWVVPEVGHLRSCLPARWKAVLDATASSLAVRVILLDRSLRYGTVDRKRHRAGTGGGSKKKPGGGNGNSNSNDNGSKNRAAS